MRAEVLEVFEEPEYEDEITDWKIISHMPYGSPVYNPSDEIRIGCLQQNIITHPGSSHLLIEGKLTANGAGPVDKNIQFVNNGMAFIFEEIRYLISGVQVDVTRNVGITSLLKNYCTLDYPTSRALKNAGWNPGYKEDMLIADDGTFRFCLPLNMVLGFMEDYQKIITGVSQELVLLRNSDDRNCVIAKRLGAPPALPRDPKLTITRIAWRLPYIEVDETRKLQMLRSIQQDATFTMPFRSWELHEYPSLPLADKHLWTVRSSSSLERPRYVIVGLQDTRKNAIEKDNSIFDHCDVENVRVYLNSRYYPYESCQTDFPNSSLSILYEMYRNFRQSYYSNERGDSPAHLTPSEFKNNAVIFPIDTYNQNSPIKSGPMDIRVEVTMRKALAVPTVAAYCLIIHDNVMQYSPLSGLVRRIT